MIAIDNAAIVTPDTVAQGTLLIDGARIAAIAHTAPDRAALRARARETIDASNHYLMPGMIDAHAHAYGSLLRGTENSLPLELWALHTTLYGRAYTAETMRAAILLGAAERIRAGITASVDHSPALALAHASLAAHEASGLRIAYAPMLHDLSDYALLNLPLPDSLAALVGGPPPLDADAFSDLFASLVQAAHAGSGRVQVQLGPNAPQRCTPAAWSLWRRLRDTHNVGVHTHLLETRAQATLNARYNGSLVAAMAGEGMLEGTLTCAHGVWLTAPERETLARHNVTVSHNPASNLMLGSGVLDFNACTACGLRLGLGNDSTNTAGRTDHFAGMRLAMMLPRRHSGDPATWPTPRAVFTAATENGAAALGLHRTLGQLAPGQLADLVLVRATAPGTLAHTASLESLVQFAGPEHVASVMVDGVWVMRDGHILAFDEAAALATAASEIAALQSRAVRGLPTLLAALPDITARFLQTCS